MSTAITRAAINKANAQHSTGPKTAGGKTKSSLNAVKTALTGRTVLLPSDDADDYRQHVNAYVQELRPIGILESALVQSLADHAWRLDRLIALEMNSYAIGHATLALQSDEHRSVLQYRAHLANQKMLHNLHIQEARLRRQRAKDMAELKELQQTRLAQEQFAAEQARAEQAPEKTEVGLNRTTQSQGKTCQPPAYGFEFSTAEIERIAAARPPANSSQKTRPSSGTASKKASRHNIAA